MNIPISGQVGILNSGNSFTSWMQNNLVVLGPRTLRELCMPGSHDAGMSTYTSGTAFAKPCNTLTQTLGILGQLSKGSRYFDIRPVISAAAYYAGHYTDRSGTTTWQGANGQSIQSIITDINTYTASNQELVILYLSSDLDTDLSNSSYAPFTQDQWNNLLSMLEGIHNLYIDPNPTTVDLDTAQPPTFHRQQSGVGDRGRGSERERHLARGVREPGFLLARQPECAQPASDTNDLETMANDQLVKMKTQRTSQNSPCFLLSWTLTQERRAGSSLRPRCRQLHQHSGSRRHGQSSAVGPTVACVRQPVLPEHSLHRQRQHSRLHGAGLGHQLHGDIREPSPQRQSLRPSGSYVINSQNISITLNATCQNVTGAWVRPHLPTRRASWGVFDIHNTNGQLGLSVQSGVPNNPTPSGSPFIPSGSYTLTSHQISVTISASCLNMQGQWVPSTVTFTADEASSITDINNINGQLGLTKV